MKPAFVRRCPFLLFAATIMATTTALADGISVTEDLKHARGEHTVIVLDSAQIRDVERLREVVLSDEQLRLLRAVYEKTPRKLVVLSSRWNDCTCGIGVFGIWCRVGELDVPHSRLRAQEYWDKYLEENRQESERNDSRFDEDDNWASVGKAIILDSQGDMYLDGKWISEGELRRLIDEISSSEVHAKRVSRYIYFDLPPPISEAVDKRIRELLQRTNTYCKTKQVELSAVGMELD